MAVVKTIETREGVIAKAEITMESVWSDKGRERVSEQRRQNEEGDPESLSWINARGGVIDRCECKSVSVCVSPIKWPWMSCVARHPPIQLDPCNWTRGSKNSFHYKVLSLWIVKREVRNIHLDIAARLHLVLCPLQLITAWPQNTHTMWIHSYLHEQTQKFSGDWTVRDISSSLSSGQSMQLKKKEKGGKVISLMDLCIILGIKEVNYCYSVVREHVKRKKKKKNTVLVCFFLDWLHY